MEAGDFTQYCTDPLIHKGFEVKPCSDVTSMFSSSALLIFYAICEQNHESALDQFLNIENLSLTQGN